VFGSLQKWLGRLAPSRRCERRFTMITRQGCHLCDEAWSLLTAYQKRYGYRLDKVDVDSDPELVAKHGNCVPVVIVDGQVRFRGQVNEVLLRRLLERK
jgi:glutaredoxin